MRLWQRFLTCEGGDIEAIQAFTAARLAAVPPPSQAQPAQKTA